MVYSFECMTFPEKVDYLLRNSDFLFEYTSVADMTCSFKNITYSLFFKNMILLIKNIRPPRLGFVQRALPRSSPKNAAAPLYQVHRRGAL